LSRRGWPLVKHRPVNPVSAEEFRLSCRSGDLRGAFMEDWVWATVADSFDWESSSDGFFRRNLGFAEEDRTRDEDRTRKGDQGREEDRGRDDEDSLARLAVSSFLGDFFRRVLLSRTTKDLQGRLMVSPRFGGVLWRIFVWGCPDVAEEEAADREDRVDPSVRSLE